MPSHVSGVTEVEAADGTEGMAILVLLVFISFLGIDLSDPLVGASLHLYFLIYIIMHLYLLGVF